MNSTQPASSSARVTAPHFYLLGIIPPEGTALNLEVSKSSVIDPVELPADVRPNIRFNVIGGNIRGPENTPSLDLKDYLKNWSNKTVTLSASTGGELYGIVPRLVGNNIILPSADMTPSPAAVSKAPAKMVPLERVVRTTSAFVGVFSALALIGNLLTGALIVQPFICILFIVASIGFFAMARHAR